MPILRVACKQTSRHKDLLGRSIDASEFEKTSQQFFQKIFFSLAPFVGGLPPSGSNSLRGLELAANSRVQYLPKRPMLRKTSMRYPLPTLVSSASLAIFCKHAVTFSLERRLWLGPQRCNRTPVNGKRRGDWQQISSVGDFHAEVKAGAVECNAVTGLYGCDGVKGLSGS